MTRTSARIVIDGLKAANAVLSDVQRRLDGADSNEASLIEPTERVGPCIGHEWAETCVHCGAPRVDKASVAHSGAGGGDDDDVKAAWDEAIARCLRACETVEKSDPSRGPWRIGRTLSRTLYFHDRFVGVVDTPGLAIILVTAANEREAARNETLVDKASVKRPFAVGDRVRYNDRGTIRMLPGTPGACAIIQWDGFGLEDNETTLESLEHDNVRSDYPSDTRSVVLHLRGELFQRAVTSTGYSQQCRICTASWSGTAEKHHDGCILGRALAFISPDPCPA